MIDQDDPCSKSTCVDFIFNREVGNVVLSADICARMTFESGLGSSLSVHKAASAAYEIRGVVSDAGAHLASQMHD